MFQQRAETKAVSVALGAAFLVALGVFSFLSPKSPEMVEVLMAGQSLAPHSLVTPKNAQWVDYPATLALPHFLTRKKGETKMLQPYFTQRAVEKGEPLTKENLSLQGKGVSLANLLGPGMRAVSIRVDPAALNTGLINPGDVVDVLVATDQPMVEPANEVILCATRVLAIGQRVDPEAPLKSGQGVGSGQGPWGTEMLSRTATLEVTPRQAAALSKYAHSGAVFLSLHASTPGVIQTCVEKGLMRPEKVSPIQIVRGH